MGGLVFSSGPDALETPRMPPAVYHHVRQHCIDTLCAIYKIVTVPVEAPEKNNHGDIDILVAGRNDNFNPETDQTDGQPHPFDAIITALKPKDTKSQSKDNSMNLAICWPSDLLPSPKEANPLDSELENSDDETLAKIFESIEKSKANGSQGALYIQVDVQICSSTQELQWRAFKHAHGDAWNLLGTIIRPYGLTADEKGLVIRIEEMENTSRKRSRIFLTNKPGEVLEFFGMDNYPPSKSSKTIGGGGSQVHGQKVAGSGSKDKDTFITGRLSDQPIWPEPFTTIGEMFEYVTTNRMFWLKPEKPLPSPPESEHDGGPQPDLSQSHYTAESEGAPKRENLKSQDRRRLNTRKIFRVWIEEFLPSLRANLADLLAESKPAQNGEDSEMTDHKGEAVSTQNAITDIACPDCPNFPYQTRPIYTRAEIRNFAFKSFPGTKEQYEAELAKWLNEENIQAIKRGLRTWIPVEEWQTGNWRGECFGGFRRMLFDGDEHFGVTEKDADPNYPLRDDRDVWDAENVKRFVETHWKVVGDAARAWYGGLYRDKQALKDKSGGG